MADIRFNLAIRDDFERADENPLAAPWYVFPGAYDMLLTGGKILGTQIPTAANLSYWSTETFTGDDVEAWGYSAGSAALQDAFRWGLFSIGGDGYQCIASQDIGSGTWLLRRYDGGSPTDIDSDSFDLFNDGDIALMQLTATHVRTYRSTDGGSTWDLKNEVADSTYRSDFYLIFGGNGTETGWDAIGGGIKPPNRPQIFRWVSN